ncbi:anthranilate synthase component I [Virgibacillus sp. MSP4-1]|uniref:anthranilate synthase component I n=1 Tax=Virgibacillus sp. MSP4-1 TaxID=2700081 RepID=UPI0003A353D8|nr:anthranilate synthase component I [Virgibacillus sp. MSP4-1]QHS24305.1 anthranilate synthase component I [Virgibacillus sp. MSP4-1]
MSTQTGTGTGRKIKSQIREIKGDTLTPISIFHRLKGPKKFLLESSLKHEDSGRFSMIGSDPYLSIKGTGEHSTMEHFHQELHATAEYNKSALQLIQEQLGDIETDVSIPFHGGAVGYAGYDTIRQFEQIGEIPPDNLKMPDIHFQFYEKAVVMDHKLQKVYLVVLNLSGTQNEKEMEAELHAMEEQLKTPSQNEFLTKSIKTGDFTSNVMKQEYEEKVKRIQQHIRQGDIFQAVLSQRLQAEFYGDAFSFYRKLRTENPSPYMFYIDFEDYLILGASPESLIKVQNQQVITNPIAGTRKRGRTEEEDLNLEKDLLNDEKELAEHRMLVDLGRNDIGRVSEIGSVDVSRYMEIERYQHVMHIVSEVKGQLRPDVSSLDALTACLPAGTVSGAPKIRAMQILNELEPTKRGPYSGAVGYINVNGDLDLGLAIRTMIIKNQTAYVQAGAGVVMDSVPENEYEETLQKAKSLLEVRR